MWSSLLNLRRRNEEHPSPSEEKTRGVTFHGDSDGDSLRKTKRISKSWVQGPLSGNDLTEKHAQHNLLDEDDLNLKPSSSSTSNQLHTSASSTHSKKYINLLEPKRISSRPLFIIRKSDSDILRFKEENFDKAKRENKGKFVAIPIIPADEMVNLTSEIKLWNKNRRNFKLVFAIAMICGLAVFLGTLVLTFVWYGSYGSYYSGIYEPGRPGSLYFNLHMNGQVTNLILMALGLNTFRFLPIMRLINVIYLHTFILTLGAALSVAGSWLAADHKKEFLNNEYDTHLYSLHSWIGLTAYFFMAFCFVSGIFMIYYPSNFVKEAHSRISILAFMLCSAATIAGFFERAILQMGAHYKTVQVHGVVANLLGVLVVVFAIFVRLAAASFVYRRRPKPLWDVIVYRSMEALEDVYLEIHDMYDSFELWVKQVNAARQKALRVPTLQHNRPSVMENKEGHRASDESRATTDTTAH